MIRLATSRLEITDNFEIVLRHNQTVIGHITVSAQHEIDIVIAEGYRQQGYHDEALLAMINYLFKEKEWDAIYCNNDSLGIRYGFTPLINTNRHVLLNKDVYFSEWVETPIGRLIICATTNGIAEIGFKTDLKHVNIINCHTQAAKQWLNQYFSNIKPDVSVVFDYQATPFQHQVYHHLAQVEFGELTTYKSLARKISPTMSSQAVGTAVGNNPILILLGCHRVIKSNGQMGNYGPGKAIKRQLLKWEGSYDEAWDSE